MAEDGPDCIWKILYNLPMKDLVFLDSSLDDVRRFPSQARHQAGFELDGIQRGKEPSDWKPMKNIGPGVRELRIHKEGEHRLVYVAKFEEAVYVLHAFKKKTQKTAKRDLELATSRYRALVKKRTQ